MTLEEFDALPCDERLGYVRFLAGAFGVVDHIEAVLDFLRHWNAQHAGRR